MMKRSSNVRQTNTHIFSFLGSTDTKQRFSSNFSCFGDHDAIIALHRETSAQKFTDFFDFVTISLIAFIAFYCKSRHTIVCRAAQEAGAPHREYIDRKKENVIFTLLYLGDSLSD